MDDAGDVRYSGRMTMTSYKRPFPPVTSRARDGAREVCDSESEYGGYGCTREKGHSGRHEAGGMNRTKYADWE